MRPATVAESQIEIDDPDRRKGEASLLRDEASRSVHMAQGQKSCREGVAVVRAWVGFLRG